MTYFRFLSADNTVNVELMTDLIGFVAGSENLTVCQKNNFSATTDAVTQLILNTFSRDKHSVSEIVAFANAYNLKLEVVELGKLAAIIAFVLAAPTNLTGIVNSATQVTVSWNKSSGATGYTVERATTADFSTGLVGFNIGDLETLAISGLTTVTPYWFRVRATNAYDVSNNSTSITRTTS
jgi:hypothetical protein